MRRWIIAVSVAVVAAGSASALSASAAKSLDLRAEHGDGRNDREDDERKERVQLGPRPFFLIHDMDEGRLKRQLQSCSNQQPHTTDFTIGHRGGGTLQFPEETAEDYEAGIRMGAGIVECDVTFTKDLELVCRHAQNDLHTTTNILLTPLASKCTQPF